MRPLFSAILTLVHHENQMTDVECNFRLYTLQHETFDANDCFEFHSTERDWVGYLFSVNKKHDKG